MQPLRALLLSAGFGSRLRPLTESIPKCLVKVGDLPILQEWIIKLDRIHCRDILINTHYLSHHVESFRASKIWDPINIKLVYERNLLGTAGTLLAHRDFFRESTGLLVHVDNFTHIDLHELLNAHNNRPSHCIMTMLTFSTDSPSTCGIVQVDKTGVVSAFHEKSLNPPGNIANGAVYVFDERLFSHIDSLGDNITDFSNQVIPSLVNLTYTWHTPEDFVDIGTMGNLAKARSLWHNQHTIKS